MLSDAHMQQLFLSAPLYMCSVVVLLYGLEQMFQALSVVDCQVDDFLAQAAIRRCASVALCTTKYTVDIDVSNWLLCCMRRNAILFPCLLLNCFIDLFFSL